MAIRDDASSQGWELEETGNVGDRWVLEESEQQLADEWDLEGTPEPVGQWQPVEYDKPRRGGPAWILPTLVTMALLAVLSYSAYTLVPELINTLRQGAIDIALGERGQPDPVDSAVAPLMEAPATDTPTVAPTDTVPPPNEPTQALLPSPTQEPALPVAQKLFATVLTQLGVNARSEPNVNSEVIEILEADATFIVLNKVDDEWLQLFVTDSPLTSTELIDGYVGYAAAEFFAEGMRPLPDEIWLNVLTSAGMPATPTPTPIPPTPLPTPIPPTPLPTEPPPVLELPTVTPLPPTEAAPNTTEPTQPPSEPVVQPEDGVVTITIDAVNGVNVRTLPELESDVVSLLPDKSTVPAIGRYATNDWILVDLGDGATGWVYIELVQVAGELTSLPAITLGELPPPTPTPTETATAAPTPASTPIEPPAPYTSVLPDGVPGAVVFSALGVNARDKPDANARVITILPENAALPVVGRTDDGNWLQVELPQGGQAWVFRATIIPRGNVNAVPVRDGSEAAAPAPAATQPAAPADEPVSGEEETTTGSVTATARQVVVPVFAVPSTDGERIVQYGRGTQLPATGLSADGAWIRITTADGLTGWVTEKSVDLNQEASVLPIVE